MKLSPKREAQERLLRKVYAEIDEERDFRCESCGSRSFEHSHNFPKSRFNQWICEKENITLLCRAHHLAWENCHLWELKPVVLKRVIEFVAGVEDALHQKEAYSHFTNKLFKMRDLARAQYVELPYHIHVILDEWGIEP